MHSDRIAAFNLDRDLSEPRVIGFSQYLAEQGYSSATLDRRVCSAAHLEHWIARTRLKIEGVNEATLEAFEHHLPECRCSGTKAKYRKGVMVGGRLYLKYLRHRRLARLAPSTLKTPRPAPLIEAFGNWMFEHRGVTARTVKLYGRVLDDLLKTLGEDPRRFETRTLRQFVVERGARRSSVQAQHLATAVRVFLRYLIATGQCASSLEGAIPPVARWRQASLPRYLPASEIEQILSSCSSDTPVGLRDRAILLLLCRFGLRGKEVADLRLGDIDWEDASITVVGKGRRHDRLPLTQEIGEAILAYLERGRPNVADDHVFLRARAPQQPLSGSTAVSTLSRRAMRRAGIKTPAKGSHVFRHSAATEMLRQGSSLEAIANVLRHSSIETTAIYAKVDFELLREVAQPWPEVEPC